MKELQEKVLQVWNEWGIRVMVLLTLSLQMILSVSGSRRKFRGSKWISILIWSAYSSVDTLVTFTIGNIASKRVDDGIDRKQQELMLQVCWAPLLLLHLGGPDTMVAYSLEDTQKWLGRFLGLVAQLGVALYVLIRSWSSIHTTTFFTIPIFVSAIIKFVEGTLALRFSATDNINNALRSVEESQAQTSVPVPSPPSRPRDDKELLSDESQAQTSVPVPSPPSRPRDDKELLSDVYALFNMSLLLFQDLSIRSSELMHSFDIILRYSPENTYFQLVEFELLSIYDVLYTKATIVFSRLGIVLESLRFLSSITALVCFSIFVKKQTWAGVDVVITFLLLVGEISTQVSAFFYHVFSDWAMLKFRHLIMDRPSNPILGAITDSYWFLATRKKSSSNISQYNLISSCTKPDPPECLKFFGVDEILKLLRYTDSDGDLTRLTRSYIFDHVLEKGKRFKDNRWDIELRSRLLEEREVDVVERIMGRSSGIFAYLERLEDQDFNHSLLIWHIATDLCYYYDADVGVDNGDRTSSKCLSDYMLYLLAVKPSMLPKGTNGDGDSRYHQTCQEVRLFFRHLNRNKGVLLPRDAKDACFQLLRHMDIKLFERELESELLMGRERVKGYHLVEGWRLAMQLLGSEKRWSVVHEVWVTNLAYAANQCERKEHARELRRGGELLTHVWVFMAHLGLTRQYQPPRNRIDGLLVTPEVESIVTV